MKQQDLILQNTLLNWLTGELIEKSICEKLSKGHWDQLQSWCKDHRLAPLIKHNEGFENLPDSQFKVFIMQQTRHQAFRQMQVQRELIHLDKVFRENDIDYKILKGPALAFECYPKPDMRPMRDIDVIVPKQFAVKAFNLLLKNGCQRLESHSGNPEAKAKTDKHLPPIMGISNKIVIEVHTRTFHEKELPNAKDFSEYSEFWKAPHYHSIGGRMIQFESPTFLLIHLIFHSVYQHNFDNGPLVLTDVHYLLENYRIDQALSNHILDEMNIRPGFNLFFSVYSRYYSTPESIDYEFIDDQPLLDSVKGLFFIGIENKLSHLTKSALKNQTGKAWLLNKFKPSRLMIASAYNVSPNNRWIYIYYIRNLFRLTMILFPKILKQYMTQLLTKDPNSRRLNQLHTWLNSKG